MRFVKLFAVVVVILSLNSCASSYKMIEPSSLNYLSVKENDGVKFEYKYNLLNKKYSKKEDKKSLKIAAVKITNNSGRDLHFGNDISITYENGNLINIVDNDYAFKTLKQSTATYLLYLLLTPTSIYRTETTDGFTETETIFPIGLILGPGIAGGNMLIAGSANKKLKKELMEYDLSDKIIKNGETKVGLIGIQSTSYDALTFRID